MSYYIPYQSSETDYYLEHSLGSALKSVARKVHKYILRVPKKTGKGWNYFYKQSEVDAYNKANGKTETGKVDAVSGADKPVNTANSEDEKKGFKYLLKIATMKGWRYFYSQKEIDGYMKSLSDAKGKSIEEIAGEIVSPKSEAASHLHSRKKTVGEGSATAVRGEEIEGGLRGIGLEAENSKEFQKAYEELSPGQKMDADKVIAAYKDLQSAKTKIERKIAKTRFDDERSLYERRHPRLKYTEEECRPDIELSDSPTDLMRKARQGYEANMERWNETNRDVDALIKEVDKAEAKYGGRSKETKAAEERMDEAIRLRNKYYEDAETYSNLMKAIPNLPPEGHTEDVIDELTLLSKQK